MVEILNYQIALSRQYVRQGSTEMAWVHRNIAESAIVNDQFCIGFGIKDRSTGYYEIHFRKPTGRTPTKNWLIDLYLDPKKHKGRRITQKSEGKIDPFQPRLLYLILCHSGSHLESA
jgi:hypothetical protein